jgi:hypothetical protein
VCFGQITQPRGFFGFHGERNGGQFRTIRKPTVLDHFVTVLSRGFITSTIPGTSGVAQASMS